MFIIVCGETVELSLWDYRKQNDGLYSAQFVLRNNPPYETRSKFRKEQDENFDHWQEELEAIADQAGRLIAASAK